MTKHRTAFWVGFWDGLDQADRSHLIHRAIREHFGVEP
jgi:hypothetical protein